MGINSAADKVKWAAIHFMELVPNTRAALISIEQAARDASDGTREILPNMQQTLASIEQAARTIGDGARELSPNVQDTLISINQSAHDISIVARSILSDIENTMACTNRALESITIAAYVVTLLAAVTIYSIISTNYHSRSATPRRTLKEVEKKASASALTQSSSDKLVLYP